MHNRTVRRQTLILQARIAVPPFLVRENSPFPRDESLVEGVTARAKRAESGSFREALPRAGTRKKGLDKAEQTPEEQTEGGRKADAHETPPAISTHHQETDAPLHVHAPSTTTPFS
jgi:hypothetical protein